MNKKQSSRQNQPQQQHAPRGLSGSSKLNVQNQEMHEMPESTNKRKQLNPQQGHGNKKRES